MQRPAIQICIEQITKVREDVKTRFDNLDIGRRAQAIATYRQAQATGEATFHPYHSVLA